jgi:hypothetical protein
VGSRSKRDARDTCEAYYPWGESISGGLMSLQATASKARPKGKIDRMSLSDDECIQKLAALIEHRDSRNLGEIARLISRLAVPVE